MEPSPAAVEPSPAAIRKIGSFFENIGQTNSYWEKLWTEIQKWWKTQHKYKAVKDFAEEIGWGAEELSNCLYGKESPPIVVIEKIGDTVGIGDSNLGIAMQDAKRKAEKVKYLLLLLEDELTWFRDGTKEVRRVYREDLDTDDIGYISSLLNMLGDEERFSRWVGFTTNRFNYFKKTR